MSWPATLDAYAAQLDAMRQALSDRLQVTVHPFVPPTDLGPLPAQLAERALQLFEEGAELEALMLGARDALDVAIRDRGTSARVTPPPSMVDVRA